MRTKHTFRLPPELAKQLADYAGRKRLHQAFVVETALASFLSPDNSERMEAALGKRLDRLTRQVERLERQVTISNEAIALFVRFWLTATSPVPDAALPGCASQRTRTLSAVCRSAGTKAGEGAGSCTGDIPGCRAARRKIERTLVRCEPSCHLFLFLRQTMLGIIAG